MPLGLADVDVPRFVDGNRVRILERSSGLSVRKCGVQGGPGKQRKKARTATGGIHVAPPRSATGCADCQQITASRHEAAWVEKTVDLWWQPGDAPTAIFLFAPRVRDLPRHPNRNVCNGPFIGMLHATEVRSVRESPLPQRIANTRHPPAACAPRLGPVERRYHKTRSQSWPVKPRGSSGLPLARRHECERSRAP